MGVIKYEAALIYPQTVNYKLAKVTSAHLSGHSDGWSERFRNVSHHYNAYSHFSGALDGVLPCRRCVAIVYNH